MDIINQAFCVNAFNYLRDIDDNTVDAIITDPPYLTTNLSFDNQNIDWDLFLKECLRVTKTGCPVILFGALRTALMILSSPYAMKYFRYEVIYEKTLASGFSNVKYQPLRAHEYILVFSDGHTIGGFYKNKSMTMIKYNPQMEQGKPYVKNHYPDRNNGSKHIGDGKGLVKEEFSTINTGDRYPRSVIKFSNPNHESLHPTQKPLALMEYLVRTHSSEGDLVVDPFMGSGTTLMAAKNMGRRYSGCDYDPKYHQITLDRLSGVIPPLTVKDKPKSPKEIAVKPKSNPKPKSESKYENMFGD